MALSVGSVAYWIPSVIISLILLFSFVSINIAKRRLKIVQNISESRVSRGETIYINISVNKGTILPIAPVKLYMYDNTGSLFCYELKSSKEHQSYPFYAKHVGTYYPGIEYCIISDIFGLFEYKIDKQLGGEAIYVSPLIFDVDDLEFGVSDMGAETIKRAQEDMSSPEGFRKYQIGDPLKKIHWKLSLRKNELMTRQYEEPTLPNTIVLMDVSYPHVSKSANAELVASLKDSILETAASVANHQMRLENKLKLPILGSSPFIFTSEMSQELLLQKLSTVSFDEQQGFERLIMYEMQSIRQAGAVVVISTKLSSSLAELLIEIAMKGPKVRLYLISVNPSIFVNDPAIHRLISRDIEVQYVVPEL